MHLSFRTVDNLRRLGWVDYNGPGKTTTGLDEHLTSEVVEELGILGLTKAPEGNLHRGARNGWYIPGTDPNVDRQLVPVTPRQVAG